MGRVECGEQLKSHLEERFASTLGPRLDAVDLYPGSLADFTDASAEEMLALHAAALRVRQMEEDRGAEGWTCPEFFSGYLARLDELTDLLARDARVSGEQSEKT